MNQRVLPSAIRSNTLEHALDRAGARGATGRMSLAADQARGAGFAFADEVAAHLLTDLEPAGATAAAARLRDAGLTFARFARGAIGAHLDRYSSSS